MIVLLITISCMTYPPLKKYNQDARILLEQGKDNRWVIECAGDELAIANSNYEFAKTEEKQGDILRAGTHYEIALHSAQKALKKGAIIVSETDKNYKYDKYLNQYISTQKKYGNTLITFFKFL